MIQRRPSHRMYPSCPIHSSSTLRTHDHLRSYPWIPRIEITRGLAGHLSGFVVPGELLMLRGSGPIDSVVQRNPGSTACIVMCFIAIDSR